MQHPGGGYERFGPKAAPRAVDGVFERDGAIPFWVPERQLSRLGPEIQGGQSHPAHANPPFQASLEKARDRRTRARPSGGGLLERAPRARRVTVCVFHVENQLPRSFVPRGQRSA